MAYSVIAEADGDAAASGVNIATTGTVTAAAGDTIVAFVTATGANLTASLAASDGTNTYTRRASAWDGSNANIGVMVAENVSAGTYTVTGSWDGGSRTNRGVKAIVLRGLKSASYQTGTGAAAFQTSPGTGTDAVTPGSVTPTEQPACLIGLALAGGLQTPTIGTGFTGLTACWQLGTGTNLGKAEHKQITSTSSVGATWTSTPSGLGHYSASVILSEYVAPLGVNISWLVA